MYRPHLRDVFSLAILAGVIVCWRIDHSRAAARERLLRATQIELATAVAKHAEVAEKMQQRLDEYENQYVLMRRFLRVAKQTRE